MMATKAAVEHSPSAKEAMLKVMSERPIIATRAPALHKFSVQAFRPIFRSGDVLYLNSLVGKAYNADSDGDVMTYYVPVSNKAVEEAYRLMMPSKNLLAARDFKSMPEMQEELVSGAWLASHRRSVPPTAVFNTREEAFQAYLHGKIKVDDNVVIKDMAG